MKRQIEKKLIIKIFLSALLILIPVHILLLRIGTGLSRNMVLTIGTFFGYGFISLAFYLLIREMNKRRQTEEALRESEGKYRTLIEQAADGIIVGDGTRVVMINSKACEMLGYTREEFLMLKKQDLFLPEDYSAIPDRMGKMRKGEMLVLERNLRCKDGTIISVETSAKLLENGWMQAIIRDISERKKAEEALRASEERLRSVLETANEAIIIGDRYSNIIFWNKGAEIIYGYAPEEIKGKTFNLIAPERLHAIHQNAVHQAASKSRESNIIKQAETVGLRKNGVEFPIEVSISNFKVKEEIYFTAVVRDITERKQTEKVLRESEERFRSLVKTAPGIIVCLSPDYRILEFNPEAERFFGCEREEVIGKDYFELFIPERVREMVSTDIKKAMEGEPARDSEYTLQISDGRKRVTMWNLSRLSDTQGELVGVVAVGQDITCRKNAEAKIGRLNHLYAVLSKINETIVRIRDPQELYQKACRIAVEDGLFMTAWIGLLDHETNALKLVAHWGIFDKYLEEIVIPVSGFARDGRGPAGTAFREGKSVIRNNMGSNLSTLPWHKRAVELGYRSTASFPLRIRDRIVGSLNLYADKPYFFNDDEVQLLETLANDISFAIESIELERGREKAEKLLRESEGRLRSIVENARDAIVTVDGEGNIVYWNKGAKTLYGYSAEEIIGKPIATILPERLREDHKKMIKKVLEGEILNNSLHRVTAVTKDGAEINLEGNYFIWKEEDRTFIAAIFYNPLQ